MSLQIDHVTKRYGTTLALDGLTFEVPRGEVFGFLGANGAGKTTTMRICLGIIRADAGEIRWAGAPVADLPPDLGLPARGARPLPADGRPGPARLLRLALRAGARTSRAREALAWLDRFQIPEYADKRAEELSKGNQQKVQFIAAILHRPEVLLMDEPFTGLDPINLVILREAFTELRDQGRTLIFSTHQMEAAEALCESVAIVDHGRLVAGGRLRDLKRASGRRWIRIALEGGGGATDWLADIAGVEAVRHDATGAQLELLAGSRARRDPRRHPGAGRVDQPLRGRRPEPRGAVHRARRAAGQWRWRWASAGNAGARAGPGCRLMASRDPLLPNAGIIARREYRDRVRGPLYLASTVILMGLALLVALAPIGIRYLDRGTVTRIAVVSSDGDLAQRAVAVADNLLNDAAAGVDPATWQKPFRVEEASGGAAEAALMRGRDRGRDDRRATADRAGRCHPANSRGPEHAAQPAVRSQRSGSASSTGARGCRRAVC